MESNIIITATRKQMDYAFKHSKEFSIRYFEQIYDNEDGTFDYKCRIRHNELERPLGTFTLDNLRTIFKNKSRKQNKGMKALDEILNEFFGCKKTFLATPRNLGDGYKEYFTKEGGAAYSRLIQLIEALGSLDLLDVDGAIETLDYIVEHD